MIVYADASFLVALYVLEVNSESAVRAIERARLPVLISPLSEVEVTNAMYLRVFRRQLTAQVIHSALAMFHGDMAAGVFESKPLSSAVIEKAVLLSRKQTPRLGTRALAVLHVASAVCHGADCMVTFDRNQARLADAEGLRVPRW